MSYIKKSILIAAKEAGDTTKTGKLNISAIAKKIGVEQRTLSYYFASNGGNNEITDKLIECYDLKLIKIYKSE